MAADLFESYAVTLVAALILGKASFGFHGLVFPLIVPAIGVITAIIGIFAVAPREGDRTGMSAINRGFFLSAIVSAVLVAIASFLYLPDSFAGFAGTAAADASGNPRIIAIGAVIIGLVLASAIQLLTGYFTETSRKPLQDIGRTSLTGAATVILAGISVGLESAVYSALLIAAAVYGAFLLGSGSVVVALFAVALAGTGLLTTVGVIVSMDTYGPVSDNAQGIAEMSGDVTGPGAQVLTDLDADGGQHDQGHHQGHRHRYRGARRHGAVRLVPHCRGGRPGRRRPQCGVVHPVRGQAQRPGGRRDRRGGGLPLLRAGHQRGRSGGWPGRVRGPRAVPHPPGDHGLHRAPRLQPGGRHLHEGLAAGAGHTRPAGSAVPDRRRLRSGLRPAGCLPCLL